METEIKTGHGGRRAGAGRPKGDSKLYTFRAGGLIARALDARENRTAFIIDSIERSLGHGDPVSGRQKPGTAGFIPVSDEQKSGSADLSPSFGDSRPASCEREPDFSRLGRAVAASGVRGVKIPSFDFRVVAGFPVPLDNDEKSRDIDILQLLCPHPESSYLIRVQGDSMVDAGIESGDIVIVDKSRRDPSEKDIAVCELNGEYTLKRICVGKDGTRWMVPANPDYPRFPISEDDDFSVWGIVTYIIHRARD